MPRIHRLLLDAPPRRAWLSVSSNSGPNSNFKFWTPLDARIEQELLRSLVGLDLGRRFFPVSVSSWQKEHPTPADIFEDKPSIFCESCGRDLLDPPQGIFAVWREFSDGGQPGRDYVDIHWACKRGCDRVAAGEVRARPTTKLTDAWEDIPDFCIPLIYLQRLMALLNGLHKGDRWSDSAFDKFKMLTIAAYPHIARHATTAEADRIKRLTRIPSYLGGLGY